MPLDDFVYLKKKGYRVRNSDLKIVKLLFTNRIKDDLNKLEHKWSEDNQRTARRVYSNE